MGILEGTRGDGLKVEWRGSELVVGDARVESWGDSSRAFDRLMALMGDELAWLADAVEKSERGDLTTSSRRCSV